MNETITALRQEQVETMERVAKHKTTLPHRDPLSLQSFWAELTQFRRQALSDTRIESLVTLLVNKQTGAPQQEAVVQDSINGFLQRLESAYTGFEDLIYPLRFALLHLRLGLRMLACHAQRSNDERVQTVATAAVTYPVVRSIGLTADITTPPTSCPPFDMVLMQLAATAVEHLVRADTSLQARVAQLYDQAFRLWSIEGKRKQQADQESQSLYKRSAIDHQALSDAELEEHEFRILFPSYEDAFQADHDDLSAIVPGLGITPSHTARLLAIHETLTYSSSSPQDSLEAASHSFEAARRDVMLALIREESASLWDHLDQSSVAYRIKAYHHEAQRFTSDKSSHRNFYSDPNIVELRKAEKLVSSLKARLIVLIEEWPDQMVLPHLVTWCDSVLSLHIKSPVAKVLSALEQLLVKTDDWEGFANRENSLKQHRQMLTELIVEWRRLELASWRVLLDDQSHHFANDISQWWFRLYELIIQGSMDAAERSAPDDDTLSVYLDNLVPLLHEFVQSSPLGQFESRLRLLQSFQSYCERLSVSDTTWLPRIIRILGTLQADFEMFLPAIELWLRSLRKPLEQEISNFIKLASWKDINVHALKASAQRTHHQLYKVIRKFREGLRQQASTHMNTPTASSSDAAANLAARPELVVQMATLTSALAEGVQETTHSHIKRLDHTYHKYHKLVTASVAPFMDKCSGEDIDDFAAEILTVATNLSRTPVDPKLSAEKRVKTGKALLVRKRKAWSDLLKELKRVGIPNSLPPTALANQRSARWLREHLHLGLSHNQDDGEAYLLRLSALLPKARSALSDHHDDIATRELQRGLSFIEGVFSFVLRSRTRYDFYLFLWLVTFSHLPRLSKAAIFTASIRKVQSRLEAWAASPEPVLPGLQAHSNISRLIELHNGLAHSLSEAQAGIQSLVEISGVQSVSNELNPLIASSLRSTEQLRDSLATILENVQLTEPHVIFASKQPITSVVNMR